MWPIVFPLLLLLGEVVPRLLPAAAPRWVHVIITSLLVVGLMTLVIAPVLTRRLAGWLTPPLKGSDA